MTSLEKQAKVTAYILAGGASSRFGRNKALAKIGGETVLWRMVELVEGVIGSAHVVGSLQRYSEFRIETVEDRWPGEGPLGGIITALRATQICAGGRDWNLIVGCDMPFLTREWLGYVIQRALASDAEAIVPHSEHGLEPLCACWRTAALPALQTAFDEGVRKVTEAMKRLRMEILDESHWKRFDTSGRLFWNMNTQKDYEEALRIWQAEHA